MALTACVCVFVRVWYALRGESAITRQPIYGIGVLHYDRGGKRASGRQNVHKKGCRIENYKKRTMKARSCVEKGTKIQKEKRIRWMNSTKHSKLRRNKLTGALKDCSHLGKRKVRCLIMGCYKYKRQIYELTLTR